MRNGYQSGFTLIEMVVVTAISAMVISALIGVGARHAENMTADSVGQHALVAARAASAYVAANTPALIATSGPTTPTVVSMATLSAGNYLPAGFSAVNSAGQTLQLNVIEPAPNNLLAVVVGVGGQPMNDGAVKRAANVVGAGGGTVLSTAPSAITGAYGGWTVTTASLGVSPGAGHIAANATLVGMAR